MKYTPDIESVSKHEVPDWYHDAKFGIFIHWGLYSVPAFAVTGIDYVESREKDDHRSHNPYAEWYLNTLRISGSPTQKYHTETYGEDFTYDDFIPIFNEEVKKWNPEEMVGLFKKAGAKYVVLVTKHHDGFLLWPSKYPNPKKKNYIASRDIVGDLTKEVKNAGLEMGFYYSGALDWSFNPNPITDTASFLTNGVTTPEYIEYANNHFYELIDNYEPIILWNDIGYPPYTNLNEIFAYFYNKFPEGVINNRWYQIDDKMRELIKTLPEEVLKKAVEQAVKPVEKKKSRAAGLASSAGNFHYDFLTPEYQKYDETIKTKWETTRGIGNSFGYNKFETEEEYLSPEELVRMLIDIVSKNGNLLLNVGPKADGTISEIQKKCLLSLGRWLEVNGEAIYGTRPWIRADGQTADKIDIRFTQKEQALYIHLLQKPKTDEIIIQDLNISEDSALKLLGYQEELNWNNDGKNLKILTPEIISDTSAIVFKITPKPI